MCESETRSLHGEPTAPRRTLHRKRNRCEQKTTLNGAHEHTALRYIVLVGNGWERAVGASFWWNSDAFENAAIPSNQDTINFIGRKKKKKTVCLRCTAPYYSYIFIIIIFIIIVFFVAHFPTSSSSSLSFFGAFVFNSFKFSVGLSSRFTFGVRGNIAENNRLSCNFISILICLCLLLLLAFFSVFASSTSFGIKCRMHRAMNRWCEMQVVHVLSLEFRLHFIYDRKREC